MKKWLFLLAILLVVGGLVTWRFTQKKAQEAAQENQRMGGRGAASVETVFPQRRDIRKTFQATGSVESMHNVKISPKISGRLEMLAVREGDRVTAGQVLARVDQSEVEAAVRQREAEVAQARSRLAQARLAQLPTDTAIATQIRQAEANVASAEADLRQAEKTHAAQLQAIAAALDEAQGKIDSANATVANAKASINSAQANLTNATTKYNRIADLHGQGFVAAQDVDDAKTAMQVQQAALETARGQLQSATASVTSATAQQRTAEQQAAITRAKIDADVESARARVAQADAALDSARANTQQSPAYQQNLEALQASVASANAALDSARARLDDTVLRSPIDGVVTARAQDPGTLASPGQPILTLQSLNQVWVTIAVPEEVCLKLRLAHTADVTFDALDGSTVQGRIAQINPSADLQSRQFTVRVALDNAQRRFSPGMFARVTVVTDEAADVLAVPLEAVKQGRDGGAYVFVVGQDNKAYQRPVTTGIADANWMAITSGLGPEDAVVTMSAMPLRDGQDVSATAGRGGRGSEAPAARQGRPDGGGGAAPGAEPRGERPREGERRMRGDRAPADSDASAAPAPERRRPARD